jgi:hypothetical protein
VQLNTFFALSVVDHALMHVLENFSRDYLIESIENEAENGLNPGVYPHLSLAPGQRFASKGAYIVRFSPHAAGGLEPVSTWIVPTGRDSRGASVASMDAPPRPGLTTD